MSDLITALRAPVTEREIDDLRAIVFANLARYSRIILYRLLVEREADKGTRDFIAELLGEGCEDMPDDTSVTVLIGTRGTRYRTLGEFRRLLSQSQESRT